MEEKMNKPEKPIFSKKMLCYLAIVPALLLLYCFFASLGGGTVNWGPFFLLILILDGIPLLIYLIPYGISWSDYNLAQKDYPKYLELEIERAKRELARAEAREAQRLAEQKVIEAEHQRAIASQNASEPWAIRYSTSPCPYCGHYKVRYAKWEDKSLSIAFWGIASSKIGKEYKCEHCNRMW